MKREDLKFSTIVERNYLDWIVVHLWHPEPGDETVCGHKRLDINELRKIPAGEQAVICQHCYSRIRSLASSISFLMDKRCKKGKIRNAIHPDN
jgi:hypothetical protein